MEISGIGGYRGGLVARSSVTGASTSGGRRLLEKPPASRSVAGTAYVGGTSYSGGGGSTRASEPIMLDFDLPAAAPARHSQQQKRSSGSIKSHGAAAKPTNMPWLDNLTPTVHLSEERRAEYRQTMDDRITKALLKSQAAWDGTSGIFDDPKNWKLHVAKPNLTLYRKRSGPGSDQSISTTRPFVATGRTPGVTLQDVEYGLYTDNTPDERAINAVWFSDHFLDAAVLETYETQNDDDPFHFFGMKWLLTGAITNMKIAQPRDRAFLHYQKSVTDEYGEKVLAKVIESVSEDVVPLIPDQGGMHVVRSEVSVVLLYHYDHKAKEVQLFCEGKLDPAGRSTGWMANLNLSLFAPVITQIEQLADAKYITKHGLMFPHESSLNDRSTIALSVSTHIPSPMAASVAGEMKLASLGTASWVPDKKRKACFICFKSFSLLRRRRHHCRMCGEVMCGQCLTTLPLVAPAKFDAKKDAANFPLQNQPLSKTLENTNRHGFPVVNIFKFCKKCIFLIRQERRAMIAGVGNYYFTEGMMRHYAQMQAALAGEYEYQYEDDDESGYLDDSIDDDESIVDDVQYSKRIEKLRQEHMEREKQKLRDQQQKTRLARSSVRLFDDMSVSDKSVATSDAASRQQSVSDNDSEVYEFDDLLDDNQLMVRGERLKSKSDGDRLSFRNSLADSTHAPSFTSAMPIAATTTTGSNNSYDVSSSNNNSVDAASDASSLLPIDIRRRSFSIPDHFEKMERSIAEQEALISSIQQQRAANSRAEARLPIGAVMRSLAQTKPAMLSARGNSSNNSSSNNQLDHEADQVTTRTSSLSID